MNIYKTQCFNYSIIVFYQTRKALVICIDLFKQIRINRTTDLNVISHSDFWFTAVNLFDLHRSYMHDIMVSIPGVDRVVEESMS